VNKTVEKSRRSVVKRVTGDRLKYRERITFAERSGIYYSVVSRVSERVVIGRGSSPWLSYASRYKNFRSDLVAGAGVGNESIKTKNR